MANETSSFVVKLENYFLTVFMFFLNLVLHLWFFLNDLMVFIYSLEKTPVESIYEYLFWVERLSCAFLWFYLSGGYGFFLYSSVFLFTLSNMAFALTDICYDLPKTQWEKLQTESETETESNPSDEHQETSKAKEASEECGDNSTFEETEGDCESTPEEDDSTSEESQDDSASSQPTAMDSKEVDLKNPETETKPSQKVFFVSAEEDGKPVICTLKLSATEKSLELLDISYPKRLQELNSAWQKTLHAEKHLRAKILDDQMDHFEQLFLHTNQLLHQANLIAFSWQKEKESLDLRLVSATSYSEKLQKKLEQERQRWDEERYYLFQKITEFEIFRDLGDYCGCKEKVKELERERESLVKRVVEAYKGTSEATQKLEDVCESFSMVNDLANCRLERIAVLEEEMSKVKSEKEEMAEKLRESEASEDQWKKSFEESEEEKKILSEKCEYLESMDNFNEARFKGIAGENMFLQQQLALVTDMSEFYKSRLRSPPASD